jgi:hypothetical protein
MGQSMTDRQQWTVNNQTVNNQTVNNGTVNNKQLRMDSQQGTRSGELVSGEPVTRRQ